MGVSKCCVSKCFVSRCFFRFLGVALAVSLPRTSHSEVFHGLAIAAKKKRSLQRSLRSFLSADRPTAALVFLAHHSRIGPAGHLLNDDPCIDGWPRAGDTGEGSSVSP